MFASLGAAAAAGAVGLLQAEQQRKAARAAQQTQFDGCVIHNNIAHDNGASLGGISLYGLSDAKRAHKPMEQKPLTIDTGPVPDYQVTSNRWWKFW